jgi:predicted small lipoprotein YifL
VRAALSDADQVRATCGGAASRRAACLALVAMVAGAGAACGKKGPPLPPLLRVPAQITDLQVRRVDDDVHFRFTVPAANVEGDRPADLARIEVYGITAVRPPVPGDAPDGDLRRIATIAAAGEVQPPDVDPEQAGLIQGLPAVLRERLNADARQPVPLGRARAEAGTSRPDAGVAAAGPLPDLRRYYFAVGINSRGRPGPPSILVEAPIGPVSGPPSAPTAAYTAAELTLEWTPAPDARRAPDVTDGLLPARPLAPPASPTRYNVYLLDDTGADEAPPEPLNDEPLAEPRFVEPRVRFGEERCFVVRPVDVLAGIEVEGRASPHACVTPVDTFPPSGPAALAAVSSAGAINLIWEPVDDEDVAGYLVLRAEVSEDGVPGAFVPITAQPIRENTFRDTLVQPGTRYAYAVRAVDAAGNVSEPSNQVEETARQ